jgi:isopentenyl diphosphate isomerase/L-lactate dehydrogenase-like FMN-dependent dehydrogenase
VGYKAKIDAAKAAEEARMVELKAKFDKQRKSVAKAAASTEWQLKFDKHRETAAALVGWQAKASVKKSIAEVLVRDALQREATAEAQALTAKAQNEKELAELFMPQPLEPSNLNEHPKKGKAIPAKIKAAVWKNHFAMSIKGTCFCCKSELDALHSWHAGHIVARSKGGLDIASNLRPVCGSCNQSMGAENMDAFKARFYPY